MLSKNGTNSFQYDQSVTARAGRYLAKPECFLRQRQLPFPQKGGFNKPAILAKCRQ